MVIKVGINGFGRIGRIISRACFQNSNIQLSAINDPAISIEYICYLIKYDSTHGAMKCNITHADNYIIIDGRHIKIFRMNLPSTIPWHTAGVQYVVEASGMFTNHEKASGHLESKGVKRVIVTAPSIDIPMIILGVNDNTLSAEQKIISCASSTLYCLAPIIKLLEDGFGVVEGFLTSIHAMTPSLKPLDGLCLRGKHWRDHRGIHQNIIPAATGACKALGKIIPEAKDKISGLAFRVPIVNVSVLDLTIRLKTNTSLEEIVKIVDRASQCKMRGIIRTSSDECVSSDFKEESHSCIFDISSSIKQSPNFYKLICWYENEYSYACRVIDSIYFSEKQLCHLELPCEMVLVRPVSVKKYDEILQTDVHKKEMAVTCRCKTETNLKESSFNIYPDTLSRHTSSRSKKKSGGGSPMYKNINEMFKKWNDCSDPQISVEQNPNHFFQSCASVPIKRTETSSTTSEKRLENVKREFCKMRNLTENLLRESHSTLSHNKIFKEEFANKIDIKTQPKDELIAETNAENQSLNLTPNGGDFIKTMKLNRKSSEDNIHLFELDKDIKSYTEIMETIDNDRDREQNNCKNIKEKTLDALEGSCELKSKAKADTNNNIEITDTDDKIIKPELEIKNRLAKSLNILINDSDQDIEVQCNTKSQSPFIISNDKVTIHKTDDPFFVEIKMPSKNIVHHNKRKKIRSINQSETCYKIDLTSTNNNDNITSKIIVDQELRKHNIVIDKPEVTRSDSGVEISNQSLESKKQPPEDDKNKVIETFANVECSKYNLFAKSNASCPGMSPQRLRTTSSFDNVQKQNLYDKLESASSTDSIRSFEIQRKKSEIIHITDLTNSVDDIARLDKICKIIEISDELSDKLFSVLEKQNGVGVENKKWSFKDFCDRIKLDEFCNNVFGPSIL